MELVILMMIAFCFGIPLLLTLINLCRLFYKRDDKISPTADTEDEKTTDSGETQKSHNSWLWFDLTVFLLGISLSLFLWKFVDFKEWYEPIYGKDTFNFDGSSYTPIYYGSMKTMLTFACIAIVGFWTLRLFYKKLPPLISACCVSSLMIGFVLTLLWVVQLLGAYDNVYAYYLMLFPINYCICSLRLMRETVDTLCERMSESEYKCRFLQACKGFLSRSCGFVTFAFALMIPIILLTVIILTLFGQTPDSAIKAFTETAEWTLSQKIPPPRLDQQGHYLCTVAACGDEKRVKPLRAGVRRGELIVVNRQLLVANAFEDLIKERAPRFHRIVRGIYDRTGRPISKHITTKKRSNAVYYLMKPLEWLFVIVLYAFDSSPENRIAMQYTK